MKFVFVVLLICACGPGPRSKMDRCIDQATEDLIEEFQQMPVASRPPAKDVREHARILCDEGEKMKQLNDDYARRARGK